ENTPLQPQAELLQLVEQKTAVRLWPGEARTRPGLRAHVTVNVGPSYSRVVASNVSRLSAPSMRTRARYVPGGIAAAPVGSRNAIVALGGESGATGSAGTAKSPSSSTFSCRASAGGSTVTVTTAP